MSRIFISYSRDDKAITEKLAPLLRKVYDRDNVWYDADLRGGDEWWQEILRQVAECDHFIFLMSNESLQSKYCLGELEEARRLGKHIIPVKVRRSTTIPETFSYLKDLNITEIPGEVTLEGLNEIHAALSQFIRRKSVDANQQKEYETDLKLLKQLWSLINSDYIDRLDWQTQMGYIPIQEYRDHIVKYWDEIRNKPENYFFNKSLESAFKAFETILAQYNKAMSSCYTWDSKGEFIVADLKTARTMEGEMNERPKYEKVVDKILQVRKQHRELVRIIRAEIPDFDFTDSNET